ncbi:MAG: methyltransferase domain-containing protein [Pseudomonadota bacterium]|nr:methyltransferase domain-containing protein [Pseudomonadota bacterium]
MPNTTYAFDETQDFFLNNQVKLRQPKLGYRAGIDPVFLAASIDIKAGDRVLDVGAGHGAASICLAHRKPNCTITGIEIRPNLVRLANDNAKLNNFHSRVQILVGDLTDKSCGLDVEAFDHVMANPPYWPASRAGMPNENARYSSDVEGSAELADWVNFLLNKVCRKGSITLIHRADRLDEILSHFYGKAGDVIVFPLWPKRGLPANRVIVRARKAVHSPATVASGLVLHEEDGKYTAEASKILNGSANPLSKIKLK